MKTKRIKIDAEIHYALCKLKEGRTLNAVLREMCGLKLGALNKGGGQKKYPFHGLEVGESCTVPWPEGTDGYLPTRALRAHEKKTGKRFDRLYLASGIRFTRIR